MSPILAVSAILSALYWAVFCHRGASWPKSLVKTASVLLLAFAAWQAGGAWGLIVALLLCALGDFLLSRDGKAAFMAGVGAFAAGHVAYVVLFASRATADPARLWQMPQNVLVAGLAMLGVVMVAVLWRRAGALRGPVLAYVPVILAMGIAALMLPPDFEAVLVLPAALLFILSDFVLAMEMFVLRADQALRRLAPFIVWPTYWLAQLGFTLAFAPAAA
ncbi:lysoplasmalogenase [Marimonas arenosa]|uniref:Lysoplasmalogenase n=1 Tax=Marimonas arenosa TaxID=1795305 RepID=A0AAE3WI62_9RHOB|nr:lysoplasmalogenase [Marimonas arenosa]MDQ2091993.1 lysoplasmalogenase [Marimonas arenosa]